jgi:predicted molibdopterin-dependent oxidoreductase YjgC
MPTLTINGRPLTAAPDQTILDAARAAGIDIPTLCWYPTLPIVGNCRICLVSVEGQPKLMPACATTVTDGMQVTTESHAAVENRRGVLRLLLERYSADHLRNGGRAAPEFERTWCAACGPGRSRTARCHCAPATSVRATR